MLLLLRALWFFAISAFVLPCQAGVGPRSSALADAYESSKAVVDDLDNDDALKTAFHKAVSWAFVSRGRQPKNVMLLITRCFAVAGKSKGLSAVGKRQVKDFLRLFQQELRSLKKHKGRLIAAAVIPAVVGTALALLVMKRQRHQGWI